MSGAVQFLLLRIDLLAGELVGMEARGERVVRTPDVVDRGGARHGQDLVEILIAHASEPVEHLALEVGARRGAPLRGCGGRLAKGRRPGALRRASVAGNPAGKNPGG